MTDPYWVLINRVLTQGGMDNTYKPALLRAMADYGAMRRDERTLSWEWLAERFVQYYWPLVTRYRIRQANNPDKEPVVVSLIKGLDVSSMVTAKDFRKSNRSTYDSLVGRLAKPGTTCCLDEVVPRFHNLRGDPPAILYDYDQDNRQIIFQPDALTFLQDHHQTLKLLAIGRWVQFTERFSLSPRLWEKIADTKKQRKTLTPYRETLMSLGMSHNCFYCDEPLDDTWHVDHFLPWSFMLEDRLWNLVPSCSKCNSAKSDGVRQAKLEPLAQRNERIFVTGKGSASKLITRDFKEWSPKSLDEHISLLIRNALAEGFPAWEGR